MATSSAFRIPRTEHLDHRAVPWAASRHHLPPHADDLRRSGHRSPDAVDLDLVHGTGSLHLDHIAGLGTEECTAQR